MNTETGKRKVIKTIPPVKPKKLKKLENFAQTVGRPKVSDRLDTLFLLFLAICGACFIFKFGDLSTFVMQGARSMIITITILLIFLMLCILETLLSGYAAGYERIEKEISRLKIAHRKAEQGDVYQVQEEIELNGKRLIVPVKSNSGIATEFQLAIEKAEEALNKRKRIYDFLARITFCKEKEIFYGKI